MRKIRYLFIVIPVLVIMLFSQPYVSAIELGMTVNDLYETANGEPDWQEIVVVENNRLMIDMIQEIVEDYQLFILDNSIAIVDNNDNFIIEKYVYYLYFDIGAGDGIIVLDGELFPYSIYDLYMEYGNDWSIIFTERKGEGDYNEGYRQGKIDGENIGYWKGYDDGLETEPLGFTSILFNIFNSFGTFFAIELLPNITIGAIILIPIVFGIIAFIIGRRKDD